MPKHSRKITEAEARKLPAPAAGYMLHFCPEESGFGVRVSSKGDRAWFFQRRLDGRDVRRTLGKAEGAGAISRAAALALKIDISSELQQGQDRVEERREARRHGVTLAEAVARYTDEKRRKDGLPLKPRTVADYLAMVAPPTLHADGTVKRQAGDLYPLAAKPLNQITAEEIRAMHAKALARSGRRADYAAQVLRAVLRWVGVRVEGDPFGKDTAGSLRVGIAPPRAAGRAIPREQIRAWWEAVQAIENEAARDYLLFLILTGCRPSEPLALRVPDCDIRRARVTIRDPKNRKDYDILLSRQALEIIDRRTLGAGPLDRVFPITDANRAVRAVAAASGVHFTPKDLRKTFGSLAAVLAPLHVVKRMLNHSMAGDVTLMHYIKTTDEQLRSAWQAVADAIAQEIIK